MITMRRGFLDVALISEEREHEKNSAQDILAFRDPRDRFDAQRVNGKHRRHERTGPLSLSQLP